MNNSSLLRKVPLMIVLILTFGTVRWCGADDTKADAEPLKDIASILLKLQATWNPVKTLRYDVEARDTESQGFRDFINEKGHERDLLITHLTFMVKGPDFGWKSDTFVPATGAHERISSGGMANGILSVLFQDRQSLLLVAKNPVNQNSIPITGCNPLLEAFSFLVSDEWNGFNCPEVGLKAILSVEAWENAAKRVTSVSTEQMGSQACVKVVFGPLSGSHDAVYFSKSTPEFPVHWQHYEASYLRRETSVTSSLAKALPNGQMILIPVQVKRRDFYEPNDSAVFCTSELSLSGLQINSEIPDEDLIIDPSLADAIYDRDNEKRILIPK